jgi:hypothetical protein
MNCQHQRAKAKGERDRTYIEDVSTVGATPYALGEI